MRKKLVAMIPARLGSKRIPKRISAIWETSP